MLVLAYLLWRSAEMEQGLRDADRDRCQALAERILQRAPASRAAFAAVPASLRAVLAADGSIDHADVGWLDRDASPADADLVVDDRLERATRAEFVDGDAQAARRAHDELLAVPLVASVRQRVLLAAAWQAEREHDAGRVAALRRELDERLATVAPADLGRPAVATVVAGALRLAPDAPPWAAKLAPFLPPELFASVRDASPWAQQHAEIAQRRALLAVLRGAWAGEQGRGEQGVRGIDGARLLWWQARAGGGHDVACMTVAQFLDATAAAGRDGNLPELPPPWTFVRAPDTDTSFAGVPGLAGIATPLQGPVWLQPLLTGSLLAVLALAFAAAVTVQLRAARAEVAAVRTQSEFLTTVTHELKTPLAAIRLLGEMLADGRAKGREPDYYKMLAGEAGRLSMLIENVLDLGRLERGERAYDLRSVDVGEVVGETLAMFAPLAERDGTKVVWEDLCGSVPVHVDRGALVQALVAVLDNARKYGPAGSRIDVVTRRCDRGLAIDVRDRGVGVPVAERERIFERFVRGAAHAHGSTPGVGIGLYLARSIARRLHGDLVCQDPLDGGPGACFTFTLPVGTSA